MELWYFVVIKLSSIDVRGGNDSGKKAVVLTPKEFFFYKYRYNVSSFLTHLLQEINKCCYIFTTH